MGGFLVDKVWSRSGPRMEYATGDSLLTVYETLANLEDTYPGFEKWYFETVLPDVANSLRRIFFVRSAARITGVAIAKRTPSERKLCTLWVEPTTRNSRVAAGLAEHAFDWMGTNRPLFTVPEERMSEFARLLTNWGFVGTQRLVDCYRLGKTEYTFNGFLEPKLILSQTSERPADHPI